MDNLLTSCQENTHAIAAEVNGSIPEWLNIELLRVGPAKWDLSDFVLNHWLDGCAMLCKISIIKGRVIYHSKFLKSEAYTKMVKVNRPVYTEFGTRSYPDPCKNVFTRLWSQLVPSDLTDNGCVGIYKLFDEYYAASETCNILKVSKQTLEIEKKINLDKVIGVNLASSHVQYIEGENYAYNMTSSFITGMKYHLIKIPLFRETESFEESFLERATILTTISSSWKTSIAYYHSYGITKNFIVFIELPLVVNGFKLVTCTPKGKPLKDCFEWHPNEKTRFYIICKNTGQIVKKYYAPPFFYFHFINAYEEKRHIVADLMAYENATILDKWDLRQMRNNIYDSNNQSVPTRFVMPLDIDNAQVDDNLVTLSHTKATAVLSDKDEVVLTGVPLGPAGFELPATNYRQYNGKKYNYCYGSGVFEKGTFANSLCKLDVESGQVTTWRESDQLYPGECVFVARPGATEEDDGVLLSIVLAADQSQWHFLLILDARNLCEIARANICKGKGTIPPTIHGVFEYIDKSTQTTSQ